MGFYFDNLKEYCLRLGAEQGVQIGQPSLLVDSTLGVLGEYVQFERESRLEFGAVPQCNCLSMFGSFCFQVYKELGIRNSIVDSPFVLRLKQRYLEPFVKLSFFKILKNVGRRVRFEHRRYGTFLMKEFWDQIGIFVDLRRI